MSKKKVAWPPPDERPKKAHGRQQSREGESMWIPLHKWPSDRTLRGQMHNACCDCGLDHLLTFELVREDKGQWWLVKRAYRIGRLGKRHD